MKKSKTSVRFFRSRFLLPNHPHIPPPPIAIIAVPSMGDENHAKKIKYVSLIFLAAIFTTQQLLSPPPIIAGPCTGDENHAKKIKNFSNFGRPLSSQSSQDPRISNIESSSNIFGSLLIAISNSRVLQLRWEGEGCSENHRRQNRKCRRRPSIEKNV